jgi:ribosomal protein L3 glutamine methyltransferase
MSPELQTIRDIIHWTANCFDEAGLYYGHGTDSAWDEAVALVLATLHLPYSVDAAILETTLTIAQHQQLLQIIKKRIDERIPVPYLTHEAWFAGLPFYVDDLK